MSIKVELNHSTAVQYDMFIRDLDIYIVQPLQNMLLLSLSPRKICLIEISFEGTLAPYVHETYGNLFRVDNKIDSLPTNLMCRQHEHRHSNTVNFVTSGTATHQRCTIELTCNSHTKNLTTINHCEIPPVLGEEITKRLCVERIFSDSP